MNFVKASESYIHAHRRPGRTRSCTKLTCASSPCCCGIRLGNFSDAFYLILSDLFFIFCIFKKVLGGFNVVWLIRTGPAANCIYPRSCIEFDRYNGATEIGKGPIVFRNVLICLNLNFLKYLIFFGCWDGGERESSHFSVLGFLSDPLSNLPSDQPVAWASLSSHGIDEKKSSKLRPGAVGSRSQRSHKKIRLQIVYFHWQIGRAEAREDLNNCRSFFIFPLSYKPL